MSWIICDTNIMIDYLKGNPFTTHQLSIIGHKNIILSSITSMELYCGARNKSELKEIEKNIRFYDILYVVDEIISQKATELVKKYHLSHNLDIPDALIAATAIIYGIPLWTHNLKHFQYLQSDLKLHTPL